jgi:hypothetical protein
MAGVPLAAVSEYLAHSTAQQTMVYPHLQPDNAAHTVAAMMSFYEKDSGDKRSTKRSTGTLGSKTG